MLKNVRFALAAVLLAFGPAHAKDTVTVSVSPGYANISFSSEFASVTIERSVPYMKTGDTPIDEFFAAVKKTLEENGIAKDWQLAIPDAPFVRIEMTFDGNRLTLISAHPLMERGGNLVVTERGAESLQGRDRQAVISSQSDSFQKHRKAVDKILILVRERINVRLGN